MNPQEYKSQSDVLYSAYIMLYDETQRLRKENKILNEELGRIKNINNSLSTKLTSLSNLKTIKMGADWLIEGENIIDLHLGKRMKYNSPICNVKISKKGKVAFTCNKKIFLFENDKILLVDQNLKNFDIKSMRYNLTECYRCIFDFLGEDLVTYQNYCINKYHRGTIEWSIEIDNVMCLRTDENFIYVGTDSGSIIRYDSKGNLISQTNYPKPFKSFIAKKGKVVVLNKDTFNLLPDIFRYESSTVSCYDYDGNTMVVATESSCVKIYRNFGEEHEIIEKIPLEKPILAVKKQNDYVFVAQQDRTVNVYDLDSKKLMRIVMYDNVVDICSNDHQICFVDNNGSLRIWDAGQDQMC